MQMKRATMKPTTSVLLYLPDEGCARYQPSGWYFRLVYNLTHLPHIHVDFEMSLELALRLTHNQKVFVEYPLRLTSALFDTTVIQAGDSLSDDHCNVMFLMGDNVWRSMYQRRSEFNNSLMLDTSDQGRVGVYWSSFYTAPIYSTPEVGNILHIIVHDGRNSGGCATFMADVS